MLFKDILNKHRDEILPEMDSIFEKILENQNHPNDLLLILINGNFSNRNTPRLSPYVIGPEMSGLSEVSHYNFIHFYRSKSIHEKNFDEYLKDIRYDPKRKDEITFLVHKEELSVHMEMLIYLKIWEMTQFLKNWYEIVRLLKGEHYEWHFKLNVGNDNSGIATAQELIRIHIRDEIQHFSQTIYNKLSLAYKSQIRNSIAHSNYSFMGRNILPNNANPTAGFEQIHNVTFDDWIEMFHTSLMLHDSFIYFKKRINEYFSRQADKNNNVLEIRVNKADGTEELRQVSYRPEWKDWQWTP